MFYRASMVLGICLGLSAHSVLADTLSGELGVSATTVARCILNSVSPMIFPPYSPLNPNPDRSSASIVVTCSRNIAYNLGLNKGRNPTATVKDLLFGGGLGRGGQKFVYTLLRRLNSKQYWGDLMGKDTLARSMRQGEHCFRNALLVSSLVRYRFYPTWGENNTQFVKKTNSISL